MTAMTTLFGVQFLVLSSTIQKSYITVMNDTRKRPDGDNARSRLAEASELASAITEHPGVADLLRLYERHAQLVQRANVYVTQRRVIIFASSDTTA